MKVTFSSRAKTIDDHVHSVEKKINFEIAALFNHLYGKFETRVLLDVTDSFLYCLS